MRPSLFAFERTWSDAAFDAMYPDPPSQADGDKKRPFIERGIKSLEPTPAFASMLGDLPFEQSMGLRVALWIVALAPFFTIRRLGTIASLAPADRVRVLDKLLASPIYAVRQLVAGFKAVGSLLYARTGSVRAQMLAPLPNASGEFVALRVKDQGEPTQKAKKKRSAKGHAEHAA
jgi:hypothetical protein